MLGEFKCRYICDKSLPIYENLDEIMIRIIDRVIGFGQRWTLFA